MRPIITTGATMALRPGVATSPTFRATRVLVLLALGAWRTGGWHLALNSPRPWEGSTPELVGVTDWWSHPSRPMPLSGGSVNLLHSNPGPADPNRLTIAFPGERCTPVPRRITASYSAESIEIEGDPDPRGCRSGSEGLWSRAFEVTLVEPIDGRPSRTRFVSSPNCTGSQFGGG